MTHEAPLPNRRSPLAACSRLPLHGSGPTRASERGSALPSCEETIKAVIALAQTALSEPKARAISEHSAPRAASALSAQQQLTLVLRNLEPELALKVRTLMVAGRDGQSIHTVKIPMTLADGRSSFHAVADDTSENGPLLAEYLRRGHALAHASGLDLERPIGGWGKAEVSGDERDWQRFGRQLAQSNPEDWHCLLVPAEAPSAAGQLYLQHAQHGSWSFHAQLDRAQPEAQDLRRAAAGVRSTSVSTRSLAALVPRLRKTQGVALRRAARAICARVGACAQP
jgi:hypothetical protein